MAAETGHRRLHHSLHFVVLLLLCPRDPRSAHKGGETTPPHPTPTNFTFPLAQKRRPFSKPDGLKSAISNSVLRVAETAIRRFGGSRMAQERHEPKMNECVRPLVAGV